MAAVRNCKPKVFVNYVFGRKLKMRKLKREEITNISTIKYDLFYVDKCCSADSMTGGSPAQISLNSVNTFVSLFSGFHSRPAKDNACQPP
jgi:hypothetical protein